MKTLCAGLVAAVVLVRTAAASPPVAKLEPAPPAASSAPAPAEVTPAPPPPSHSRQKLVGLITMAGGVVLLGTGIGFGLSASGRWNDAKDVCGGTTTCKNDDDTEYAQALSDSAGTRANVSTVLFVAGGIAAAAGVYLFLTAPDEHAVTLSATGSATSAGIVLGGAF